MFGRLIAFVAAVVGPAVGLTAGCAGLEQQSSGHVGCPPSEITISEQNTSFVGRTWTAACRGQTYYCSTHGGGEGTSAVVACTPAAGPPGGAAAAPEAVDPGGCSHDAQCKGDRVCEQGVCVNPPPAAAEPEPEPAPAPAITTATPES